MLPLEKQGGGRRGIEKYYIPPPTPPLVYKGGRVHILWLRIGKFIDIPPPTRPLVYKGGQVRILRLRVGAFIERPPRQSRLLRIKRKGFSQPMGMKIKIYEREGKTMDERETCVPPFQPNDKTKGVCTR